VNFIMAEVFNNSTEIRKIIFDPFIDPFFKLMQINIDYLKAFNNLTEKNYVYKILKALYITAYLRIQIIIKGKAIMTLIDIDIKVTIMLAAVIN
jgi:hypothetical protein